MQTNLRQPETTIVLFDDVNPEEELRVFYSVEEFENYIENEKDPRYDVEPEQIEIDGIRQKDWNYFIPNNQ